MRRPPLPTWRLGATAVLALLVLLLAAGCGGGGSSSGGSSAASGSEAEPQAGGTLRISQGEEVINLDPLIGTDASSINIISQINEPLWKVNAEGENEPWLVTNVKKSGDQRVWTLQLRQGVKFSTGQPMTSADVLFTLEEARKSEIWESLLAGIEKVTAPSPSTIVITNSNPAPELDAVLSQWSFGIVPKNYGGVSAKEFAQHPIGTGPFMLGPWKHGESITLERNPNYWETGQPYLDKAVFQTVASPESRVSQLKGGQLGVIYAPPWSQVGAIESTPELAIGDYPLGYTNFLILNSRIPLFKDQKVREAVDLAVDREGIVNATLGGHGEPAGAWIPPTVPNSNQTIEPTKQDVAKAKTLLKEAVAGGADPSFTLLSNAENAYWGTAAQIVQQNLEEVGFNVNIKSVDEASRLELLAAGNFDAGALEVYDATPSPAELFGYYNAYEGAYSGADTTQTTKLSEQAQSEVDPQKRQELWYEIQEIVDEEQFLLPLTYSPYPWAYRDEVSGFTVAPTGIFWLAETSTEG
ncbi:MAG: ABC transporter substrate-binding protein [Solirubrobacterales bacterium]